ncbi:hypothetical protein GY45DRAFT_1318190 [Cubamyces sp. BRFM 1775]|nr:hypothetical protein GY45DRAFT_1318190 [Cubamyces sp. BRFM 1775]
MSSVLAHSASLAQARAPTSRRRRRRADARCRAAREQQQVRDASAIQCKALLQSNLGTQSSTTPSDLSRPCETICTTKHVNSDVHNGHG